MAGYSAFKPGDDLRSETKADTCHGWLWPAQESVG